MAAIPEPHLIIAASPESLFKMATSPESLHKMVASPEPLHKMAATPEPSAITDVTSVFLVIVNVAFEDTQAFYRRLRLVSILVDPLLVLARATGIPSASELSVKEIVSLSSVLSVMV
ncbi:hypothetical protein M9458_029659, partial [Cirrhinus mrigala]